jgi:hypothetical protein
MIFLRRFKKYIIIPDYSDYPFIKLYVNINQIRHGLNTKIIVISGSEVCIFMELFGKYKYFMNQKPVKRINLRPEEPSAKMQSKYRVSIRKSIEWQSIYLFDQTQTYKNIRSIVIDHNKKMIRVSKWP